MALDALLAPLAWNPFFCAVWPVSACVSFDQGFPLWAYCVTLMVMGPGMSIGMGVVVSKLTGEWAVRGPKTSYFRREMVITMLVLFFTSPFMAVSYKTFLEGAMGQVYHGPAPSMLVTLLQVVAFNVLADMWFYFVHRAFHTIHWLYKNSHYLHHSAHPVNSFMGNGGDVLELITQGELQIFVPPLFLPIHAQAFILNAVFMQCYVLILHSGCRVRFPMLYKWVVDPYEHNIHHYYGFKNYNFGLYFTFWDKLLGTHKETLKVFEKTAWDTSRSREQVLHTPANQEQADPKDVMYKDHKGGKSWSALFVTYIQKVLLLA